MSPKSSNGADGTFDQGTDGPNLGGGLPRWQKKFDVYVGRPSGSGGDNLNVIRSFCTRSYP
jgi:hypothetical protein